MVQNPRAASGSGHIRPLNSPRPVQVNESRHRLPISIVLEGRSLKVTSIIDTWEINDEWWRGKPIARLYYRVTTQEGSHITIFRDLVDGQWYRQQA